jgi:hypothetical protein
VRMGARPFRARGSRYVHGREDEDEHGLSSTLTQPRVAWADG